MRPGKGPRPEGPAAALDPQDRPGGAGPGPKGWTQGPWDFPSRVPGRTCCGTHCRPPTVSAAVWVNKAHSTAELFINEHMLHLGGLRSQRLRGCKQPNQLTQHVCVSLARQVGGCGSRHRAPLPEFCRVWWLECGPQSHVHVPAPEPVNVLSLGKRVFAEKALPPNTL